MNVLIVEDSITSAKFLEIMLQQEGFDTLWAPNLAEADIMVHSHQISLILLDLNLPDGNGLDFCKTLMSEPEMEGLPVLIVSANSNKSVIVKGFEVGAVDYIPKPIMREELLARIRTHLRLRSAYESLSKMHDEYIKNLTYSQQHLMTEPEFMPEANFQVFIHQKHDAGGDFYDVISTGNQIYDYIVSDVSGHHVGSSLWTASFKTLLNEFASTLYHPATLCRMINTSLLKLLPEIIYFTAIYARLNRRTNKLVMVNAGHLPVIIISREDGSEKVWRKEGDVLGAYSNPLFGETEIDVRPGDRIFLYTDGIIERGKSRKVGQRHLVDACKRTINIPVNKVVPEIMRDLDIIDLDEAVEDDVILLCIEV